MESNDRTETGDDQNEIIISTKKKYNLIPNSCFSYLSVSSIGTFNTTKLTD